MLMTRADLQNRPLFVDGIPELKIPTMPIPDGEDMTTWHNWAPTGAVLVIDEAQRIFRPRPAGAKVPDYIQELETHRHKGIDFFILTQHPRLIDVNLRSLVGEHRNISKTMIGLKRVSYWQKCANPESRNDVADAKNSIFKTKTAAFGMYKSAEEHNQVKGVLSSWIWFIPLVLCIIGYLYLNIHGRFEQRMQPQKNQVVEHQPMPSQPVVSDTYAPMAASEPKSENLSAQDFEPTIASQPWTAPIYNGLNRNVQTMPYPAGCVLNDNRCTCYTEQATPVKVSDAQCRDFVQNGIFNPYLPPSMNTKL